MGGGGYDATCQSNGPGVARGGWWCIMRMHVSYDTIPGRARLHRLWRLYEVAAFFCFVFRTLGLDLGASRVLSPVLGDLVADARRTAFVHYTVLNVWPCSSRPILRQMYTPGMSGVV